MDRVRRQFELFVVPNFLEYLEAERALTATMNSLDANARERASREALRTGMNAAVAAYHLADAVWQARTQVQAIAAATDLRAMRESIENAHCTFLRGNAVAEDLTLLGAVVDAYKHAELGNPNRAVTNNRAMVVVATAFGQLALGEGKFGGAD